MFKACEVVRCKETESFNWYESSSEAISELKLVMPDRSVLCGLVCAGLDVTNELYRDHEPVCPLRRVVLDDNN